MFVDFYDYLCQILYWCQSNCLYFNNVPIEIKQPIVYENNVLDDDWVDYGFGENDVIH